MRKILLKLQCSKAGGCCGGGSRKSVKYAILTIEEIGQLSTLTHEEVEEELTPSLPKWDLVEATPLFGNYMTLAKKYPGKPPWAGTVVGLKLDKNPDFMRQLNALKIIPKGCVIEE